MNPGNFKQFNLIRSIRAFTPLLMIILLFGCSDDDDVIAPENKLKANAGTDQTVIVNTDVTLNGTNSTDGNGGTFSFEWTIKTRPSSSTAIIANAGSPTPTFTPDKAGIYTVMLKIANKTFSSSDEVRIIVNAEGEGNDPQPVVIFDNINEDRVLENIFMDASKVDYIVAGDIEVRAKLTVMPGVVVEFEEDESLLIYSGQLVAAGTPELPITFTGKQKIAGFWKGILFYGNNTGNELSHVQVEFGGSNSLPQMPAGVTTNIAVAGTDISGGALKISNSTIRNAEGSGIYVSGKGQLSEPFPNLISGNSGPAITAGIANLPNLNTETLYKENGFNGVETGGLIDETMEILFPALDHGSYFLSTDLIIQSGVNISAGVKFKVSKGVLVDIRETGYLTANGTAGSPVIFEAIDPTVSNYWTGILFQSENELNFLNYVEVSHAGYADMPSLTAIKTNIGVASGARASISNSTIRHGSGWGIAIEQGGKYNDNIATSNTFENLVSGNVKFPTATEAISLTGHWVDQLSFASSLYTIDETFFDRNTGTWFHGADNPWTMEPGTAFGLKITEDGHYTWIIAQLHSGSECFSYSAEHFKGTIAAEGNTLSLIEESWRSKYYNSCALDENVDMDVQPDGMTLTYSIEKLLNVFSGEEYFEMTIITPDGSSHKFYRK